MHSRVKELLKVGKICFLRVEYYIGYDLWFDKKDAIFVPLLCIKYWDRK